MRDFPRVSADGISDRIVSERFLYKISETVREIEKSLEIGISSSTLRGVFPAFDMIRDVDVDDYFNRNSRLLREAV